jgi:hypothetical protein
VKEWWKEDCEKRVIGPSVGRVFVFIFLILEVDFLIPRGPYTLVCSVVIYK